MHLVLLFLCCCCTALANCPLPESIAPACVCTDMTGGSIMTCSNMLCPDDLINPIKSLLHTGSKIYSLAINNSSLLYIPHDLFVKTSFESILFLSSQIMSLSDTDLAFEGLESTLTDLRATDAQYIAQWDWQQLRNLTNLKLIDVNWISMGAIVEPFPKLPKLTALGIMKAEISFIADYAFHNLPRLQILNMNGNDIKHLKRNMFPTIAELTFLDFSDNELSDLPKDFFMNMPKLSHVQLDNNKFITLQEDVFAAPMLTLMSLTFNGNEFRCDCRMRWLVGRRVPYVFNGYCHSPEVLSGSRLKDLDLKDLWC